MKKILLVFLAIFVFYSISIFVVPNFLGGIGSFFGLSGYNNWIIQGKNSLDEYIAKIDLFGTFDKAKDDALELKQNVDTAVKDTQEKIDTIRTQGENTIQSVQETKESLNRTIQNAKELQKSVQDIIPNSSSGIDIDETINKLDTIKKQGKETLESVKQTKESVQNTAENASKLQKSVSE